MDKCLLDFNYQIDNEKIGNGCFERKLYVVQCSYVVCARYVLEKKKGI